MNPIKVLLVVAFAIIGPHSVATATDKPNFIVILTDDLGYGDFGCYGAKNIRTPNIDKMAQDGTKLTSFYVSPVCSPTRAALLTGCYPQRVGIGGVQFQRNPSGLSTEEITLPELLQREGYATALIGKWHLGYKSSQNPLHHGFDYWMGTIASNSTNYDPFDQEFALDCIFREGFTLETARAAKSVKSPLLRNNKMIEFPSNQTQFTKRYTEETIRFIKEHKNLPFFIYLAHNMPHVPLHASDAFRGKSSHGIYGDVIEELDWGIGEVLRALKENGLDDNTLVILTSDNGPKKEVGGSSGVLRGGKGSTFEGGVRVPCIMRWPGKVPAGLVNEEYAGVFDLLPTLVNLAGGEVPTDRVIDGRDIWPVIADTGKAKTPHDAVYYFSGRQVRGVRAGQWKLLYADQKETSPNRKAELTKEERKLPRSQRKSLIKQRSRSIRAKQGPILSLFNLDDDLSESKNVIKEHPETAERLKAMMETFANELKRNARKPDATK